MIHKKEEFLIVGVIAGAFIALFYDLFQSLLNIIFPISFTPLIKIISSLLALLVALIFLKRYIDSSNKNEVKNSTSSSDIIKKPRKIWYEDTNNSPLISVLVTMLAGALLTVGAQSNGMEKIGYTLGAVILFIIEISRRTLSAKNAKEKINNLEDEVTALKLRIDKIEKQDNPKSDNQSSSELS